MSLRLAIDKHAHTNSTKFVFCEMPSSQGQLVYVKVKLYINENDKCDALLREGLATAINPEKEQKTLKLVITSAVFSGIGDEHRLVVLGARPATKDDVNIEISESTPCTPKKRSREADGADEADAAEASVGNAAIPISDLGKAPGKLVFNGKVVEKTDVIAYKSGNGEFFKIKVQDVDDENASIWCVGFTEVCRMLHAQLDVGETYRFVGGKVKAARPPPDGGGGEGKDAKEVVFTTETKVVSITK